MAWRSPIAVSEDRNFAAPQRYILGAGDWRSPIAVSEDRNAVPALVTVPSHAPGARRSR